MGILRWEAKREINLFVTAAYVGKRGFLWVYA